MNARCAEIDALATLRDTLPRLPGRRVDHSRRFALIPANAVAASASCPWLRWRFVIAGGCGDGWLQTPDDGYDRSVGALERLVDLDEVARQVDAWLDERRTRLENLPT
jgi:hypothetical protein